MDLRALEDRIEALEAALFASEHVRKPKLELCKKVDELQHHFLTAKIPYLPHWDTFLTQYSELNKVPSLDLIQGSLPLDLHTKIALICAHEEPLKGYVKMADQFSSLLPILDNENIHSAPSVTSSLAPLRNVHLDQLEACDLLHNKVEALLDSYNNMINLLSLQFVVYDQILEDLEQRWLVQEEEHQNEGEKEDGQKES